MIAAVGPHGELGLKGGMPWGRVSGDLAHFVEVTTGDHKLILCGHKTWQGLPRVAKRRMGPRTCVVSRQLDDGRVFDALSATCAYRSDHVSDMREVWGQYSHMVIIGGAEVYRSALEADIVDVIHLSVIHHPKGWDHDVTLPAVDGHGWVCASSEPMPAEDGAPHGWDLRRLVRDPAHPAIRKAEVPVTFTMNWMRI